MDATPHKLYTFVPSETENEADSVDSAVSTSSDLYSAFVQAPIEVGTMFQEETQFLIKYYPLLQFIVTAKEGGNVKREVVMQHMSFAIWKQYKRKFDPKRLDSKYGNLKNRYMVSKSAQID